jgi:hypothetical protein
MSAQPKDDSAPLAAPKQAAAEVLAGRPKETARRWLGWTVLVVFALFAIDTYLVVTKSVLPTSGSRLSFSSSTGARSATPSI